jgi:hypothetical protein
MELRSRLDTGLMSHEVVTDEVLTCWPCLSVVFWFGVVCLHKLYTCVNLEFGGFTCLWTHVRYPTAFFGTTYQNVIFGNYFLLRSDSVIFAKENVHSARISSIVVTKLYTTLCNLHLGDSNRYPVTCTVA